MSVSRQYNPLLYNLRASNAVITGAVLPPSIWQQGSGALGTVHLAHGHPNEHCCWQGLHLPSISTLQHMQTVHASKAEVEPQSYAVERCAQQLYHRFIVCHELFPPGWVLWVLRCITWQLFKTRCSALFAHPTSVYLVILQCVDVCYNIYYSRQPVAVAVWPEPMWLAAARTAAGFLTLHLSCAAADAATTCRLAGPAVASQMHVVFLFGSVSCA